MYVTSDMACNQPNSATPMSQARISAQNNRIARVGQKFTSGNWAMSNLVQTLGGTYVNVPGTTPRPYPASFANSPACSTPVLAGPPLYGRRLPIQNSGAGTAGTGQPTVGPDGTLSLPVNTSPTAVNSDGSLVTTSPSTSTPAQASQTASTPASAGVTVSSPAQVAQSGVYGAGSGTTQKAPSSRCTAALPPVFAFPVGDQGTNSKYFGVLIVVLGALGLAWVTSK